MTNRWLKRVVLVIVFAVTLVHGVEQAPVPAENQTAPAPALDPDKVLVTVNGQSLYVWQAEAMVKQRAASDLVGAASFWTNIQVKAVEARKRGIEEKRESIFILNLYRDHYLTQMLDQQVAESVPPVSDEEAQKYYQENLKKYERPLRAEVQHILLKDKAKAEDVVDKARAEGANFDALIEEFSQAADKSRKGRVVGEIQRLQRELGSDVANSIASAKANDILGPVQGAKGFEIIKVNSITPAKPVAFEEVKTSIVQQLQSQNKSKAVESLTVELDGKATVEKSEELKALEEKAKTAPPAPKK